MRKSQRLVEVRETDVGRGLFAERDYQLEEVVGELFGRILDDADYESDYCVHLKGDAKLEPEAPFCYVNHSCQPNCELVLWRNRRHNGRKYPRVWLQTVRSISLGEELTIDYAWPSDAAIPCLCRSDNCRGWIVHADELPVIS